MYAQFIQDILDKHQLGRQADQLAIAAMMHAHINLIGDGREEKGSVGRIFHIGNNRLSAVPESGE